MSFGRLGSKFSKCLFTRYMSSTNSPVFLNNFKTMNYNVFATKNNLIRMNVHKFSYNHSDKNPYDSGTYKYIPLIENDNFLWVCIFLNVVVPGSATGALVEELGGDIAELSEEEKALKPWKLLFGIFQFAAVSVLGLGWFWAQYWSVMMYKNVMERVKDQK